MLPSLPFLLKTVTYVTAATTIYETVKGWFDDDEVAPEKTKPKSTYVKKIARKKHDKTRFTQVHFDAVVSGYQDFVNYNATLPNDERLPRAELVKRLNESLSLDKSVTAYARIWNGKVNRNDLPAGVSDDETS